MKSPRDEAKGQVREAKTEDVPAILALYRQLIRPVAPDVDVNVRGERIDEIKADPHNFLWVLEAEDQFIGTAFVTLCLDPMHGRQPYAVLENFVIDENQRAKGYGSELMRFVVDFCYHADCSKIMLQSHAKRVEAHAFFAAQGFSGTTKQGFVKYRSQMRSDW